MCSDSYCLTFAACLALTILSMSPNIARPETAGSGPPRSALVESCLAEMPAHAPTDCLEATATIKQFIFMAEALFSNENPTGIGEVFDAIEALVHATPEEVRPLLSPLLADCALWSARQQRGEAAYRQLCEVHDLILLLDDEMEEMRKAQVFDGTLPEIFEDFCKIGIGAEGAFIALGTWKSACSRIEETGLDQMEKNRLAQMRETLESLVPRLTDLVKELDKKFG